MLYGWVEVGVSNNLLFAKESNEDIIMRTVYNTSKVIIGNTSGVSTNAGIYVYGNNVGIQKVPDSNVALDVLGSFVATNQQVGLSNTLGNFVLNGTMYLKDQASLFTNNTTDLVVINSNATVNFVYNTSNIMQVTNKQGFSIYDDLYAPSFNITSDQRLKKDISDTNTEKDVEIFKQLRVVDYTLDKRQTKGFLAQEVEKLLPHVVHSNYGEIPLTDIYGYYDKESNTLLCEDMEFEVGDRIDIEDPSNILYINNMNTNMKIYVLIREKDGNRYTLDESYALSVALQSSGKVKILCKHVKDLRSMDMNQVIALQTSVIQNLLQRIEVLEKFMHQK